MTEASHASCLQGLAVGCVCCQPEPVSDTGALFCWKQELGEGCKLQRYWQPFCYYEGRSEKKTNLVPSGLLDREKIGLVNVV